MAYMSQERKKELAPTIKAILKKYGFKGSLSIRHHSTLVLTIQSGIIDAIADCLNVDNGTYINVNHYHYERHFTGDTLKFLKEVIPAMMVGNHDNSDIYSDYFDVGWYIDVQFGKWDTGYQCKKELEIA